MRRKACYIGWDDMEDPGNKDREDYEEVDLNMDSKQ